MSEERFLKLSGKYEDEQSVLKQNIKHLQVIVDEETAHEMNADVFLRLVRKYNNINALTPEILREFIDKIIVYHREQEYGQTVQDVEIFYRFIGYIKLPEMTTAQKERLIEIFGRDDKEKAGWNPCRSSKKIATKNLKSLMAIRTGCGGRTWTYDLRVMSPTSYQLLHPAATMR